MSAPASVCFREIQVVELDDRSWPVADFRFRRLRDGEPAPKESSKTAGADTPKSAVMPEKSVRQLPPDAVARQADRAAQPHRAFDVAAKRADTGSW